MSVDRLRSIEIDGVLLTTLYYSNILFKSMCMLIADLNFAGRKTSATDDDQTATESSGSDEGSSRRSRGAKSSNNRNEKYSLRKSKRKATVDYNEHSDYEYEYEARNTISSRGRPIKMKGAVRA